MVVTGGSSGIGLAAAVAFARGGDEVVLLGRDPKRTRHAVDAVREAAHLLLDRMRAAATPEQPARLVTTSSAAESWGTLDVGRPGRRQVSRWLAYGASKQANVLFTVEAARRWTGLGIVATCFFPSLIRSGFASRSPAFSAAKLAPGVFRTSEQGADTLVWLATDPAGLVPAGHFAWRRPFVATPRSTNADRARRLWTTSLAAVGVTDSPSVPHE